VLPYEYCQINPKQCDTERREAELGKCNDKPTTAGVLFCGGV
jgi:hypothetical protein